MPFFPKGSHAPVSIRELCLALILGVVQVQGEVTHSASLVDTLTLETALALTLDGNPTLAARQLEISAREAGSIQAGRRRMPEINLDAENFAGSGNLKGVGNLEATVGLGQVLELGGKRVVRMNLAGSERDLAQWDLISFRLGLETEVRNVFTDVLAAQELLRILQDGLGVNQQILETARLRHNAGKAPATEEMKAKMAYSLNHIEIDRAAQNLRTARTRLASLWSNDPPSFKAVRGDLRSIPDLPSLEDLLPKLINHPDLARWKTELAQRRFSAEAARAESVPDISVGAGIRYLNNTGYPDVAMVAGVTVPLPSPNRNKGSILEAGHRLSKAEKEKKAAETRLSTRLRTLHETLEARIEEVAHLKDELLPESNKTLQASREAYQMGKLSFLEVLDSHRTLYELNIRFIATLAEYRRDWNELESLVSTGEQEKK